MPGRWGTPPRLRRRLPSAWRDEDGRDVDEELRRLNPRPMDPR